MRIQISWLLQKPTDLDLHCFQRQDISGFSRTRVKLVEPRTCNICAVLWQNEFEPLTGKIFASDIYTAIFSIMLSLFIDQCFTQFLFLFILFRCLFPKGEPHLVFIFIVYYGGIMPICCTVLSASSEKTSLDISCESSASRWFTGNFKTSFH